MTRLAPKRLTGKIILLVFTLVSLSVSLAGLLFYTRSMNLIREQSEMYTRNLCLNLSRDIDNYIEEMERVCRIILGNPEIQGILERRRNPGYTDQQYLTDQEMVMNLALSFTSVRDSYIIQLFDENGLGIYADASHFISYQQSLFENAWTRARKTDIDERRLFIVPAPYSGLVLYSLYPAFYVIRPVRRIRDNRIMGYLTVTADSRYLFDILRRYAPALPNGEIRLLSDENKVLLTLNTANNVSDTGSVSSVSDTGLAVRTRPKSSVSDTSLAVRTGPMPSVSDTSLVVHTSPFSAWRTEIRSRELYGKEELAETGLFAVGIIGMSMVASLLFAWLFAVYLMRPVQRLTQGMERVGKGDFTVSLNEERVDQDLRQIVLGFNTMVAKIRALIRTVHEEKLLVKSAQLEALRYQINPHFLYNTLQTIEAIGEIREAPEVQIIARSLGKLFRYNTQVSSEVFLYEEIDQMATYFAIEQIRFGDKIAWECCVTPELRDCRILRFILQPLIENAVVHGFRSITRKGCIRVSVERKQEDLEIAVWDNGLGMTEAQYADISQALSEVSSDNGQPFPGTFMGILNVHRRIVNFYGSRYGLRYERNREALGVIALLRLPIVWEQ